MAHTNHFRYVLRQRRLALTLPARKPRGLSSKTHQYQTGGMAAEDIIWRRSKLGLKLGPQDIARLSDFLSENNDTFA